MASIRDFFGSLQAEPVKPEQLVCEICGIGLHTGERVIFVGTLVLPGESGGEAPGRRFVHLQHLQDAYASVVLADSSSGA